MASYSLYPFLMTTYIEVQTNIIMVIIKIESIMLYVVGVMFIFFNIFFKIVFESMIQILKYRLIKLEGRIDNSTIK